MLKPLLASTLGRFRIIAFLEGISLLLIFFVSMPLKYLADIPEPNMVIGMAHGILFLLYIAFLILVKMEHNWSFKKTALAFLASLIPFGTFYADKWLFQA